MTTAQHVGVGICQSDSTSASVPDLSVVLIRDTRAYPTLDPNANPHCNPNPMPKLNPNRLPSRYQLVAVDFLQPAAVGRVMKQLAAAAAEGDLGAPPLSRHGLSSAPQAMRIMSQVSS